MSAVISLFLLASGIGCDKGSDSAGEADADTDTDTDTDTDVEKVRYLEGSIEVTVTDVTGKKTKCDTTIDITGEETGGGCLYCDFQLDTTATVASEKGSDCDYQAYPLAMLVEGDSYSDIWLGWSDSYTTGYGTYSDLLWFGYGVPGYPGPYWNLATVSYNKYADYSGGLLEWTRDTQYLGNNLGITYCGPYAYTGIYSKDYYGEGTPNFGGNYTGIGSLDCSYNKPYERWTFYGVDNGYAYVSVDTVAPDSSFDPLFYVSTGDVSKGDACMVARADENFECTYPAANGYLCSSVKMPTDKGEIYTVTVQPWDGDGDCDGATGDYMIFVDTAGDPSLTQGVRGELYPPGDIISAAGSATITMQKETD